MNEENEAIDATDPSDNAEEVSKAPTEAGPKAEPETKVNDEPETDSSVAETAVEPERPELPPLPPLPEAISINAFREKPLSEIYSMLEVLPVKIPAKASKSQLVFDLVAFYAKEGVDVIGEGVLEQAKDNYAMLRDPAKSFKTSPDDLYVSGHLIREHGLVVGQKIKVRLRAPKGRDKYISASEVLEVEGAPVAEYHKPKAFDDLTAMFPDDRIILENQETGMSPRVLDLVAPLGKGQRGLIVAPPRGGKTIMLKQIAKSIQLNHPEVELIILLLDERPEEVTDFEETVEAEVFSSTFDEPAKRHAQVSDLVMERAKRLVELGKDVVLLLDSLTRLARGHNNAQRGGPIGSGGLSPAALQQSRKFFGAARNCEEGGSLTILATALVETESKMDEVIFEEFKGTGNMEVRLDRELAEQRIYPAIHIPQSGTRNDDRLYHPDEMAKVLEIRRQLASLPIGEAIETLLKNLSKRGTNAELLLSGLEIR
ncbi:MAG: transcription termination factor Rho [Verrucomicrobiae bacterium]|nr:transcription termination factor Rho [Verrucomicrobiae bacterium]NNJ85583.1 transcription termination factor Rho [Akkermansiaceae bacterium]